MGILYFADDLAPASVLWMRRMLDAIADDVAVLVTEAPIPPLSASSRPFAVEHLGAVRGSWWARGAARLGLSQSNPGQTARQQRLRQVLQEPQVSAVLVHYLTLAVRYARVWENTPKPVFVHCHGFDVTWHMRKAEPPHLPMHSADYVERVRRLPKHVSFIANSHETSRRLRQIGVAPERIAVKYLGVEAPQHCPSACEEITNFVESRRVDANRNRVISGQAADDELQILYLGRLVDCKGPDLVIRAFERASAQGLRGRLVLAGDGPLRLTCELARARSPVRDRIELPGEVDAATGAQLRSTSHIFTAHNCFGPITLQSEAFGVSILEAMAAGLPIVTGRSGAIPELITDGEQGLLFEPGDIEAHADALLTLSRDADLRRLLGWQGWLRARDTFSLTAEAAQLRQLLGLPARAFPVETVSLPSVINGSEVPGVIAARTATGSPFTSPTRTA